MGRKLEVHDDGTHSDVEVIHSRKPMAFTCHGIAEVSLCEQNLVENEEMRSAPDGFRQTGENLHLFY